MNTETNILNEKGSNRLALEKIGKEILQLETQEEVDGFVYMFLFQVLTT